MCVPGCQETVRQRLSRRNFFKVAGGAAAALSVAACAPIPIPMAVSPMGAGKMSFSEVMDLTHTLGPDFPTFDGAPQLEMERLYTFADNGYNMYAWHIVEHTGTHMDAPMHFSPDQNSADQIPVANLVVPLVVVDIRAKAEADADAQLTPDDLAAFEAQYGPIPDGACVAMNSGWDQYVNSDKFRNADADGVMHFPGFHPEAASFLLERNVNGIAVDTLSLDYGMSADFSTHYTWLPANRWGMECVANLGQLPVTGAIIVAGGPKIAGATGGPSRVIALV